MSAVTPKADMCSALGDVCFVPDSGHRRSFDNLVGKRQN